MGREARRVPTCSRARFLDLAPTTPLSNSVIGTTHLPHHCGTSMCRPAGGGRGGKISHFPNTTFTYNLVNYVTKGIPEEKGEGGGRGRRMGGQEG